MTRCRFIYLRARANGVEGGQCEAEATYLNDTLCRTHRCAQTQRRRRNNISRTQSLHPVLDSVSLSEEADGDKGFPRQYSEDEIRQWVDEGRAQTDPMKCWRRGCIVCGRSSADSEMTSITIGDLIMLRESAKDEVQSLTHTVDTTLFKYKGALSAIDGIPIDCNGLLTSDELIYGAPVVGRGCKACYTAIKTGSVLDYALVNGLWTGIDAPTPLSDLTWIEEKLIARVHVSVQIQKCRSFRAAVADGFHPQRQVKGHILTYPMEPATMLCHLPLAPSQLVGLIKVVFLSRNPIRRSDADKLRFYIVRREKVDRALRWLIFNNSHYHDVVIDEETLTQLPQDGIPEDVYAHLDVVSQRKEDACGHSRYDAPDEGTSAPPHAVHQFSVTKLYMLTIGL